LSIRGAVQGVGFRPFVYRLAQQAGLAGWVNNSSQGVTIEIEGEDEKLCAFQLAIDKEKPPRSFIQSMEATYLDAVGLSEFEIRESDLSGSKTAIVLPDIATCPDCLTEVFDPNDRRFRYPFTNCTNCGPRFSIIESLPYDRPNTTMKTFTMCPECLAEYEEPLDRRFHAQPNACPDCGPQLELWDPDGNTLADGSDALLETANAIRAGRIVAVKGLGGFHLIADASNDIALRTLREKKGREEKPLALMVPSIEFAESLCDVSDIEKRALGSPERPIVILKATEPSGSVSAEVAPENPYLGCMLPYTPLHHLLMSELGFPVVATSGNLSDEPICIDENEALTRLRGIADLFLVHDRPIVRHVDDSIVRVAAGREMVVRRARGFAPLPIPRTMTDNPVLAVGAHLKNTIAASRGDQTFISQHIGDLESPQSFAAFRDVIVSFRNLYGISPSLVARDEHPDYMSTRFAESTGIQQIAVQHHYAHVLSCMAENELEAPVLGIAWDGTGLGNDGTIWGGEFLRIGASDYERIGHFRNFPLPGGEMAAREPRRSAIGLLYEAFGDQIFEVPDVLDSGAFNAAELKILRGMLRKGLNSPRTSSAGRLFDAAAAITGLRHVARFEGQAAMLLEFAIGGLRTDESYNFELVGVIGQPIVVDWRPALTEMIADVRSDTDTALIAARFHNMLVESIVAVAHRISEPVVAISGGCFQNKYLLERAVERLRQEGFRPYWHQRVPTNDGGISLGQTLAADRFIAKRIKESIERRSIATCA
jgi:hydrogenase maturation protein HypF